MSQHWQQQLLKYDMVRASRSPHHRARQNAIASRPTAKSAITITDPNRVKTPAADGKEDGSTSDSGEGTPENHPSSTTAPVAPAARQSDTQNQDSSWHALDLGGINLKNLPRTSGLWSFAFLENLFLNHNALQSIPPGIARLKNLKLLDLSGNLLQTLPPELGMVTTLKELYLFDNHLVSLPYELGTLHQLQTIGIEGNPLAHELKEIVQREGTPALIAYLRDNAPVPEPPPQRIWRSMQSEMERQAQEADPYNESLTVLCYNILCERAATERLYGYTPKHALMWSARKNLILDEVKHYNSDFICLQEVDVAQYEDTFLHHLSEQGYEGVFWPKSRANTMDESQRRLVDGCATFFKSAKYNLVEKQLIEFRRVAMQRADFKKTDDMFNRVFLRDNIAVATLVENKATGSRLIVVNVHIHWDAQQADVKLVQTALLVDEVDKIASRFARYPPPPPKPNTDETPSRPPPVYTDGTKIPIIICGDFNSIPESGVYEFLSNGTVPSDHPDFLSRIYGNYTSEGLRHRLGLRSAYSGIGELPMTNYTPSFQGSIDYIWYTANNLTVTSLLGEIDKDYLSKVVGFPNVHFPSDHVAILSEFRVKLPKDTPSHQPTFPSNRTSSSS
ncbi:glucose-repressible alcohol dehydrogenase transcriptional effector [Fomitiporia mediterranea MF3/22]|uniref:glucose-repressible alcohol dehydrogenase transcriptional effector n=1 Tax=Fomitiporia mediterranea (strain MF3/22) TaxID=694068 RepID=UPI0004409C7C|nr:glucose-repressible alcohol dehydrogenase transcriptional effector [Fomitiporia mediterranea MF3/22]EJD03212.1 glucose-repressible alcohol dehydrogenase transcriptional effector [Fomitiporia mediterranea MF3/22]